MLTHGHIRLLRQMLDDWNQRALDSARWDWHRCVVLITHISKHGCQWQCHFLKWGVTPGKVLNKTKHNLFSICMVFYSWKTQSVLKMIFRTLFLYMKWSWSLDSDNELFVFVFTHTWMLSLVKVEWLWRDDLLGPCLLLLVEFPERPLWTLLVSLHFFILGRTTAPWNLVSACKSHVSLVFLK